MMRAHLISVLSGAALICVGTATARSEPARVALVISNAQYASMPPLGICGASAVIVRDALRGKGFEVIERHDLGRGEFDAAIGNLARRAAASPSTLVALYYCGYALEFNGRSFLLPTSAGLARDSDVLTQGIISKSLVDSLVRIKESGGFVLLDVFKSPNSAASGLARLAEQAAASTYAVIGVSNDVTPGGPTAASLALRNQVADIVPGLEKFTEGMRGQLSSNVSVTAHFVPALALPSPPPPPPPPPVVSPPAASAVPATPTVSTPPATPPPPTRQMMADEEQMSEQDRRLVQVKLATLGYYTGRIDANFGAETRAAIRRYQFEIKAEMTGRLTAEQATKLVDSVR
ncbi:MAG: peptidoglycan-binding protein [Alphaproteobacteria bacterium]|nr:peptidoglycan-binding protein [Alphaproteobacteria bacterium]